MKADGQCQDDSFDFEQRWFCGNHSNVGGGYDYDYLPQVSTMGHGADRRPQPDAVPFQFPLHWIMQGAITAGLDFVKITPLTGADCCDCPVRDELKDADNLFEDTIWKADEMFSKYFGSKSVSRGPAPSADGPHPMTFRTCRDGESGPSAARSRIEPTGTGCWARRSTPACCTRCSTTSRTSRTRCAT